MESIYPKRGPRNLFMGGIAALLLGIGALAGSLSVNFASASSSAANARYIGVLSKPERIADFTVYPGQTRTINWGNGFQTCHEALGANVAVIPTGGQPGHVTMWKSGTRPNTSVINYDNTGAVENAFVFTEIYLNGSYGYSKIYSLQKVRVIIDWSTTIHNC
ncbi:MAG: hypothetical protein QNJ12_05915 [Ilumatobacter sp.]|uniref:hypothetical protein n=1 Tax=Ilumatobacter sp. TaxID=1967498 RepID=UPI00261D4B4E|nr:hypothetical protein [Ilumatobacter sp.]MDJ0768307.1 hypothetical protein [Ilumatobacter sp.]